MNKPYAMIGRSIDLLFVQNIYPELLRIEDDETLPHVVKIVSVDRQILFLYALSDGLCYNHPKLHRITSADYEINSG